MTFLQAAGNRSLGISGGPELTRVLNSEMPKSESDDILVQKDAAV